MIRDYFVMAWGSLTHRKVRSYLTLLGIFIGIMAVVSLISLGQGLQHALTSEFLELGADKIMVSAKSVFGNPANQQTNNQLGDEDLRTVERTQGVNNVAVYWQRSAKVQWSDETEYFPIIGASSDPIKRRIIEDFFTLKLESGRRMKQGDDRKAMIGWELTNPDKLRKPMKLGDKITVGEERFEVVGIYEKMGDPVADNSVYLGEDATDAIFGVDGTYDAIVVQVNPGADPEKVADAIALNLRQERNLDKGEEDFDVQTPQDLIDSFNTIFNIVRVVIFGIAAISLIVGGIGIMNTMYTAVLERTKEIGIMKAIGARNSDILLIFLIESGLLGLIGGAIGVTLGLGIAKIVEIWGSAAFNTTLLQAWWSWWLIFGALAFAFFAGMIAGILPARQAARQQAVDSLRYE